MGLEAYEIKRVRGHLLTGLRAFYPNGVSGGLLFRDVVQPVFPSAEWVECLQQLNYLSEKGYIEAVQDSGLRKTESARKRLFRLTAAGYDVASGVVSDLAIEMEL